MTKHLLYTGVALILITMAACGSDEGSYEQKKKGAKSLSNIELFVTSCESTDSSLCDRQACIGTDCGIEDYYFTLKGNLIQRVSCQHEEDALWAVGKYRMSDSGIFYQMDKVYIVPLKYTADGSIDTNATNYNRGRWIGAADKEPYLLGISECNGIRFSRPYSQEIRDKWIAEKKAVIPYGKIYYEDKDWADSKLAEMRKVKALADL